MSALSNFSTAHGCYCGNPGAKVARRGLVLFTRKWEVDVFHSNTGEVHTNVITLCEPVVSRDGYRWEPR